jgi:hypothetical protein
MMVFWLDIDLDSEWILLLLFWVFYWEIKFRELSLALFIEILLTLRSPRTDLESGGT